MWVFLWTGTDMVQSGRCMVAWSHIQRPLQRGGLGVKDLRFLRVALHARWLWLHRTDPDHTWTSLSCTEDSPTKALFNASIQFMLRDGSTFLFWSDPWLEGWHLADLALDMVPVVSTQSQKWHTVASTLKNNAWIQDITEALTIPVII
jgi:hypothetical protein